MILALIYLVPALLLFAFLMICFTGSARCAGPMTYYFPFTPVLSWMEWPWGITVPGGMFTGALWGRVFILSSIGLNAVLVFWAAKFCLWVFRGSCANPRKLAEQVFLKLARQKERFWKRRSKLATIAASLYLLPALFLWLNWQLCSGWTWLCSAPVLEFLARPWADWLGWHALANSTMSVAASLGVLGARIFALAALFLNAGIIFCLVLSCQWLFGRLRNDPPRLVGMTVAMTYALLALFTYVYALGCGGFLCDLGLILAAAPWSILIDTQFREGGMFLVLLMLAANAVIVYSASVLLARRSWKVKHS